MYIMGLLVSTLTNDYTLWNIQPQGFLWLHHFIKSTYLRCPVHPFVLISPLICWRVSRYNMHAAAEHRSNPLNCILAPSEYQKISNKRHLHKMKHKTSRKIPFDRMMQHKKKHEFLEKKTTSFGSTSWHVSCQKIVAV